MADHNQGASKKHSFSGIAPLSKNNIAAHTDNASDKRVPPQQDVLDWMGANSQGDPEEESCIEVFTKTADVDKLPYQTGINRDQTLFTGVRSIEQFEEEAQKTLEHLDLIQLEPDEPTKLKDSTALKQIIADLRQAQLKEQMRVIELEDELEALKAELSHVSSGDLQAQLADQRSQNEKLLIQLKQRTASHLALLRGAAHLVVPNSSVLLPMTVIACYQCYADNVPCDSKTRCRRCREHEIQCMRWTCSMKYRLGECPLTQCRLTHDSQGWLMTKHPRPKW